MAGGIWSLRRGCQSGNVSLARLAVSLCWNAPLGPGLDLTKLTMPAPGVLAVCWRYRGRSRAARTRTGRRMRQPCPAWARQWRPRSRAGRGCGWPGRPRREPSRAKTGRQVSPGERRPRTGRMSRPWRAPGRRTPSAPRERSVQNLVLGSGRWRGGGAGFTMPVMGTDLAAARLMVALLGPVELGPAGGVMAPVAQPRLRVLLGLLGVAAGRVVSAEALVAGVWGEEWSPGREQNLHALVYQLRRRLAGLEPGAGPGRGAARLVRAGAGYRLAVGPGELDVAVFTALAGRGRAAVRAGDAAAAQELLGQALGLWRGAALADAAPLCPRLAGEAARLEEARLAVIEQRIGCDLALGQHAEVVGELAGLVSEFPLRERLAALLMTALYRSGRRGEALAAYDRARRVLAGELGLDPGPELAGLQAKVLTDDPALAAPAAVPGRLAPAAAAMAATEVVPRQLPAQLTSFIGRERELREVAGLLERDRLVTLAGPGGSGKTRLAVLVAGRLLPQFDDGVFFVPLAPVRDPRMVPSTIAGVLGVKEGPGRPAVAALEEQLRDRRSLLVLDNFEHLLPAASVVSRLLAAAPQVKALVTSRTLLRIYGEREYVVAPLPTPEPQETTLAEVERYPAVQLFLDRAGMARPGFGLSAGSATAVAEICRRLDGLPLAIELAAARIRVLSPGELLGRLGRRLALEGAARDLPERQRTLRATIDWSHQLLDVGRR